MAGWVIRWVNPAGIEGVCCKPVFDTHAAVDWVAYLSARPNFLHWQLWLEKVES